MKEKKLFQLVGILIGIALIASQIHAPEAFSASVPGVTEDTIVVGMTTPMTGPGALYAKCGEMNESIFLEWGKNIHGRNIKVMRLDDGCDPVKGIAAIKKLIFDENIFLLSSGQCSNMCLAVKPIVEQSGIPFISHGCIADAMFVPVVKNIFSPTFVSLASSATLVDFAMTIPGKGSFGVIRHSDEWGTTNYRSLATYMKQKYSKDPVLELIAERGSPDVASQVLRLKQANVDSAVQIRPK